MTQTQPKAPQLSEAPLLHKLPSGTWVDPRLVESIKVHAPLMEHPARIAVHYACCIEVTPCESLDAAYSLRDRVAAEINAARTGAAA